MLRHGAGPAGAPSASALVLPTDGYGTRLACTGYVFSLAEHKGASYNLNLSVVNASAAVATQPNLRTVKPGVRAAC
jgi:hypothetical protein